MCSYAKQETPMPYADKAVRNARMREKRKKDPAHRLAANASNLQSQARAFRDPARWPARAIIRLRHIAKLKGLPFNLEASDLVVPEKCPVLGTPFLYGEGYRDDTGPSVDKIIPALGYVKGNVEVISLRANRLKHDLTDGAELRLVADYIDNHRS